MLHKHYTPFLTLPSPIDQCNSLPCRSSPRHSPPSHLPRSVTPADRRQPGAAIDLAHWPIEALSPVDCFHPSEKAHQRVAAGFWNRLTLSTVRVTVACCPSRPLTSERKSRADRLGERSESPVSRVRRPDQSGRVISSPGYLNCTFKYIRD